MAKVLKGSLRVLMKDQFTPQAKAWGDRTSLILKLDQTLFARVLIISN